MAIASLEFGIPNSTPAAPTATGQKKLFLAEDGKFKTIDTFGEVEDLAPTQTINPDTKAIIYAIALG